VDKTPQTSDDTHLRTLHKDLTKSAKIADVRGIEFNTHATSHETPVRLAV
jgi:hypothetical protein